MDVPISRSNPCADCGTKKKSMRFVQKCGAVTCSPCCNLHPNKCETCLEAIKNRVQPQGKMRYGSNHSDHGNAY
jgi:hypothetical protein